MCNLLFFVYINLLECILFIINIQYSTHNFLEFVASYIISTNIIIQSQINNYQNEINELKRQLNDEKNKNINLNKEIEILKNKNNILNIETNSLKEKIKLLENNLDKKNNELQDLIIKNNLLNNKITSIKTGEEVLAVNFVNKGTQNIRPYNLVCKNTDLFVSLEERLYHDFPDFKNFDTYFEVNNRRIKRFKTIDENHIQSNDIINIVIIEE